MQRKITGHEIKVYRLCHHEFEGRTVKDTAYAMSISEGKVRRLLKSLKRKAPQLFPILTKRQYAIYQLYVNHGYSQLTIAAHLRTTQSNIQATIQRMKDKGVVGLDIGGVSETVSYDSSMDKHVKRKF